MAMNVGSGGSSKDPDVMIDINTTPLIDVMLVLLVMLIITLPIQLHSVNLNLPTGNPPPPPVPPEVVKIDVDPASRVYWNGEWVADRDQLEEKLKAAAAQAVNRRGRVCGGRDRVAEVMWGSPPADAPPRPEPGGPLAALPCSLHPLREGRKSGIDC